jgi:hypothetical protein
MAGHISVSPKEKGFVGLEAQKPIVLVQLQTNWRIPEIPEILNTIRTVDLQIIIHTGIHRQGKVRIEVSDP